MPRQLWILVLLCSAKLSFALPGYVTFPSDIDWVTRRSDHFEIIYRRGSDAFAERAMTAAERAYRLIRPVFPEAPELTRIVLADFQDSTNGYSLDFPYPHMVIFASPPQANEDLSSLDDWLSSVILHEYVHTLHLYPAHGLWSVLRTIFGTEIVPNGLMPRLLHEGLATKLETEFTRGGRGRGPGFHMMKRMAVKAGVWGTEFSPLDRMDGTEAIWPGGTGAYFFGYYLYEDLWKRKGAKGIHDLTLDFSSNWPFFISTPFEHVYGESYPNLWADIFKRTGEETKQEIEKIEHEGLSPLRYVTESRFNKWDLAVSPDGKRVGYRKFTPEEGGTFEVLDTQTLKVLDSVRLEAGATSGICWGKIPDRELMLFFRQGSKDFYRVNELKAYDWKERHSLSMSLKPTSESDTPDHFHVMSCTPDLRRVALYQESKGVGKVREYAWTKPSVTDDSPLVLQREWPLPTGSWVSSLLVENDHTWIALRVGTRTELLRWKAGAAAPTRELVMRGNVFNLARGSDASEIEAISDVSGRNEIWAIVPGRRLMIRRVALLGGAHSFARLADNDYAVASYEQGGYDIAVAPRMPARPEPVVAPAVGSEPSASAPPKLSAVSDYTPWSTLYPRSWVPSLLFVPDGAQFGAWIPGFDLSQRHLYDLFGGYDTRGLPFGSLSYDYRFARHFGLATSVYLLPQYIVSSKSFQKLWGGSIGISGLFGASSPSVTLSAVFRRMEPWTYVGVQQPADQQIGAELDISHSFGRSQYPLDPYPRTGTVLSASATKYFSTVGSTHDFFNVTAEVDQSIHLPWGDSHVLFLSARGGYTEGNRLFNSYFQGGGELLFYQQRGFFLDRGFPIGTFLGRQMLGLSAEYRFPIARIERGSGTFPLYLKNLHGALVGDALTKSYGTSVAGDLTLANYPIFERYWYSGGFELSSDWIAAYYLPTRVRMGVYHGFTAWGFEGDNVRFTLGIEAAI